MRVISIPDDRAVGFLGAVGGLRRPLDVGWVRVLGLPPDERAFDVFCHLCDDASYPLGSRIELNRHRPAGPGGHSFFVGQCPRCHTVYWLEWRD